MQIGQVCIVTISRNVLFLFGTNLANLKVVRVEVLSRKTFIIYASTEAGVIS